jgi:hypothetical protein
MDALNAERQLCVVWLLLCCVGVHSSSVLLHVEWHIVFVVWLLLWCLYVYSSSFIWRKEGFEQPRKICVVGCMCVVAVVVRVPAPANQQWCDRVVLHLCLMLNRCWITGQGRVKWTLQCGIELASIPTGVAATT